MIVIILVVIHNIFPFLSDERFICCTYFLLESLLVNCVESVTEISKFHDFYLNYSSRRNTQS